EVVDAEDRLLGEHLVEHLVQLPRRCSVAPERLLDHDARTLRGEANAGESLDHVVEQRRGDRQVEQRLLHSGQARGERIEGGGVAVVAADVAEPSGEVAPGPLVDVARRGDHRVVRDRAEVLVVPLGRGDADDRHAAAPVARHGVHGGEDPPAGEVTGRPEEHERVAARPPTHVADPPGSGLPPVTWSPAAGGPVVGPTACSAPARSVSGSTAWPPNWFRRAAMTFIAVDSGTCDTNRANSAALMAGTATPCSTASRIVQRPSPESSATPAMP